jgi:Tfp pilus assembly protein PilF
VSEKPDDPAQRFLLGFHYAYQGFPQQAVDQLDKGLKIAPQDEMAKQLRDEMQSKLSKPAAPATSGPVLSIPAA